MPTVALGFFIPVALLAAVVLAVLPDRPQPGLQRVARASAVAAVAVCFLAAALHNIR